MYHLLVAFQFLTRLPVPKNLNPKESDLTKSAYYFPVVGAALALISWGIYFGLSKLGIDRSICITILICIMMMLTGGFHEDGLADTFDGIGGAFDKQKKLEIMKDSRIGTYGSLALFSALLLRFTSLSSTSDDLILESLLSALMLGRLSSNVIIPFTPYSRADDKSKSKPVIESIGRSKFLIPFIYTFGAIYFLLGLTPLLVLLSIFTVTIIAARWYFLKQIDGITGDILGGVNIITELLVLIYISTLT